MYLYQLYPSSILAQRNRCVSMYTNRYASICADTGLCGRDTPAESYGVNVLQYPVVDQGALRMLEMVLRPCLGIEFQMRM